MNNKSDKPARLLTKRSGHGKESETERKTESLSITAQKIQKMISVLITLKRKSIIRNRRASVGYLGTEMRLLITY